MAGTAESAVVVAAAAAATVGLPNSFEVEEKRLYLNEGEDCVALGSDSRTTTTERRKP